MSSVQLLSAVTAVNGAPGVLTNGVSLGELRNANQLMFLANNTSAGAADSLTVRLWGRSSEAATLNIWYPLGSASSGGTPVSNANKGTVNNGGAITVNGGPANSASHAEIVLSMRGFSAAYAQVVGIVGTWDAAMTTRDPGNRGFGEVS